MNSYRHASSSYRFYLYLEETRAVGELRGFAHVAISRRIRLLSQQCSQSRPYPWVGLGPDTAAFLSSYGMSGACQTLGSPPCLLPTSPCSLGSTHYLLMPALRRIALRSSLLGCEAQPYAYRKHRPPPSNLQLRRNTDTQSAQLLVDNQARSDKVCNQIITPFTLHMIPPNKVGAGQCYCITAIHLMQVGVYHD